MFMNKKSPLRLICLFLEFSKYFLSISSNRRILRQFWWQTQLHIICQKKKKGVFQLSTISIQSSWVSGYRLHFPIFLGQTHNMTKFFPWCIYDVCIFHAVTLKESYVPCPVPVTLMASVQISKLWLEQNPCVAESSIIRQKKLYS